MKINRPNQLLQFLLNGGNIVGFREKLGVFRRLVKMEHHAKFRGGQRSNGKRLIVAADVHFSRKKASKSVAHFDRYFVPKGNRTHLLSRTLAIVFHLNYPQSFVRWIKAKKVHALASVAAALEAIAIKGPSVVFRD